MNIHHLELFYFISTYGGITEAARKMPYGIQQPAISAQILRLEEDLGLKLFQRRPFQLTPAGRELYEFVAPFFFPCPGNVAAPAGRKRPTVAARRPHYHSARSPSDFTGPASPAISAFKIASA